MRQTPFYEIKLFGGMIVTIICLALSLSAYLKLEEISSDVFDVTDNWKTPPVTEVFVPLSFDADCPDGFSTITLEKSDFSGITKGPCGCVPNTLGYVSGIGNCSVEAEATAFCMSAPPRDEVKTKSWRESKICFKRDGKAATSWKNGYYRRPYPDQDGNCPKSYKRCGTGATYDKGAVCFPEDTICPVTGMLVAPVNDLPPPAEGGWVQNGTFPGGEYVLLTRREYEGERPMVDLEMHLTQDPTDGYLDGESYNPDNNKRGPCYLGSTQLFSDSPVEISDSFLWSFIVSYPGTCRRDDARFELFDRREMQRHFLENLEVGQSACNGLTLLPTDDPAYDAAQDPDFLNSGVSCDSNAAYQCSRPADQLTNCAVGDNICRAVINQNVCGQYAQAVRSLAGSDKTFGLYRRSEILWREDCDVSPDDIYSNMDPLRAALASQLAGVVLSYVLGILFGICYPLWGLYHSDIPGKLRIHNITEKRLTLIDPWIHLLKLGPLIAAIVFIGQVSTVL